jgi:hypothetical protein
MEVKMTLPSILVAGEFAITFLIIIILVWSWEGNKP